jgi:hypothetical protein
MQFGLIQYSRLVGMNFSKNSSNRARATENETWSLELVLVLVIALLFFALCFLWRLLINAEKKVINFKKV